MNAIDGQGPIRHRRWLALAASPVFLMMAVICAVSEARGDPMLCSMTAGP